MAWIAVSAHKGTLLYVLTASMSLPKERSIVTKLSISRNDSSHAIPRIVRRVRLNINSDEKVNMRCIHVRNISCLPIVNPFVGAKLVKLFSTHPPTEEQIARLESMARRGAPVLV